MAIFKSFSARPRTWGSESFSRSARSGAANWARRRPWLALSSRVLRIRASSAAESVMLARSRPVLARCSKLGGGGFSSETPPRRALTGSASAGFLGGRAGDAAGSVEGANRSPMLRGAFCGWALTGPNRASPNPTAASIAPSALLKPKSPSRSTIRTLRESRRPRPIYRPHRLSPKAPSLKTTTAPVTVSCISAWSRQDPDGFRHPPAVFHP